MDGAVEDWDELCDDNRNDLYLSDDDNTELSPSLVKDIAAPATVDKDGLIRVGPSPFKEAPFVWAAPVETAQVIIRRAVRRNFACTEFKLHEHDIGSQREEVELDHLGRLVSHTEDRVHMVCDYTGSDLGWAPGPSHPSLEATYPFVVSKGQVLYHTPPNVCCTSTTLNWLKNVDPILNLPLLGQCLRLHQEPDFQLQKAGWAWAYTALQNVSIMDKIFHCTLPHKDQVERWQQWDQEKQRAVLDHLRTGTFGPAVQDGIGDQTLAELFLPSGVNGWLGAPVLASNAISWRSVYQSLRQIAAKYGLTDQEFIYHCTLPAPASETGRVFYPYHVLSRPLAKELSWTWATLYSRTKFMLRRMRIGCNKHAEAAGYGEEQMDPLRLIYWWAHHLCMNVQAVKIQRPTASLEEVTFFCTLDRWGLPVVPWTRNPLKASLCKKQDHGIAMRFGLAWPEGEDFDPLEHFDFTQCTVTIDAYATNTAMRNYPVSSWDGIRDEISAVPLRHPFWRADSDLGLRPWRGPELPFAPQAPTPAFDIPLVPISHWVNGNGPLQPFGCPECPTAGTFQTVGLLIRHYRDQHSRASSTPLPPVRHHVGPEQDETDAAFWARRYPCTEPGCSLVLSSVRNRTRHVNVVHNNLKPYVCTEPGCDIRFGDTYARTVHVNTVHKDVKPHLCTEPGCNRRFRYASALNTHVDSAHKNLRPHACTEPGCGRAYSTSSDLRAHVNTMHKDIKPYVCTEPGCDKRFAKPGKLAGHIDSVHKKLRPYHCMEPGCGKQFASAQGLAGHVNGHRKPSAYHCVEPGCGKQYPTAKGLAGHISREHGG